MLNTHFRCDLLKWRCNIVVSTAFELVEVDSIVAEDRLDRTMPVSPGVLGHWRRAPHGGGWRIMLISRDRSRPRAALGLRPGVDSESPCPLAPCAGEGGSQQASLAVASRQRSTSKSWWCCFEAFGCRRGGRGILLSTSLTLSVGLRVCANSRRTQFAEYVASLTESDRAL